jgi:hypothetical protein
MNKKQEEFNLSEKREKIYTGDIIEGCVEWYYKYPDWAVKEFIRRLKGNLIDTFKEWEIDSEVIMEEIEKIDTLAGDKLVGEQK